MNKALGNSFIVLTIFLCAFLFNWIFHHEIFSFDNYAYVINSLSLSNLSPEPFGYFEYRPPFIPLLLAPFAKFFYSPDSSLDFMKLAQMICTGGVLGSLLILWKYWLKNENSRLIQGFVLWAFIGNRLVVNSSLFSMSDLLGSFFILASFFVYYKNRSHNASKALYSMIFFWGCATLTRYNYFTFGFIFLIEEIWRKIKGEKLPNKKSLAVSFILFPLIIFSIYFAPYVIKYKSIAWSTMTQMLQDTQLLFVKLGSSNFIYDDLLLFSLPWPYFVIAFFGIFQIKKEHPILLRLLLLYTGHFLFTHLVIVPHQYVRFLAPFLLTYIILLHGGIRFLGEKCGSRIQTSVVLVLFLCSLYPLNQQINYLSNSFFDHSPTQKISEELAQGDRVLWYGKSYPFSSIQGKDYHILPVSHNFHYASHVFKVQAGRDCLFIPSISSSSLQESVPHWGVSQLPLLLAFKIKNNDSLFYNPNKQIFYHSYDLTHTLPVTVQKFSRTPLNTTSLNLQKIQSLSTEYPEGLLIQELSQTHFRCLNLTHFMQGWTEVNQLPNGQWSYTKNIEFESELILSAKTELLFSTHKKTFTSYFN